MTLTRKPDLKVTRISLSGLKDKALTDVLQDTLNGILDHLRIRTIALPTENQSHNPTDGEMLFDGTSLFFVANKTYNQLWPQQAQGVTNLVEADMGWGLRTSALWTAVKINSASTPPVLLISNALGTPKVGHIHINNGANQDRIVGFGWGTGFTTTFFNNLVPHDGGTIVMNYVGIEFMDATEGTALYVTFSTTGVGDTSITAGYFVL